MPKVCAPSEADSSELLVRTRDATSVTHDFCGKDAGRGPEGTMGEVEGTTHSRDSPQPVYGGTSTHRQRDVNLTPPGNSAVEGE